MTDDLPIIPLALRSLAALQPSDVRLIFFTKEINLYLEVLAHQGERTYFSPHDLKILFARMCDLSDVAPLDHEPKREAPPKPAAPPKIVPPRETKLSPEDILVDGSTKRIPKFLQQVPKEPTP